MIKAIEIRERWARSLTRSALLENRVAGYAPVQRFIPRIETMDYALARQRALSIIALCSIVWLTSVWLATAIAQAQESSSNSTSVTATQPAIGRRSIEKGEAGNLVLSMVYRGCLEPGALGNSTVPLTNPHPTDSQSEGKVLPPSNPRDAELASLAALASAPSSSLPYSIQTKVTGQADPLSPAGDNKFLVYKFGKLNFVIHGLPNSFSVSSAGSKAAFGR